MSFNEETTANRIMTPTPTMSAVSLSTAVFANIIIQPNANSPMMTLIAISTIRCIHSCKESEQLHLVADSVLERLISRQPNVARR